MTALPAGRAGDPNPIDTATPAELRRRRLMIVLASAAVVLTAAAVVAALLPVARRSQYLAAVCVGLVFLGAVPLLASMIQFVAIGLNRFFIGYERLTPFYPRVAIIVPAWNEGHVIGATIERLLAMDYPPDRVRVYVVDDASTDATPDVVRAWAAREPRRVFHLRRERGGQGKAHTLNHGITRVLTESWAEALLIIDADVLYEASALRRMARHLSNPAVGAVMADIKEGSTEGNYLTRLIAYEYITAQAAARRAQNVFGVMACLAGGAQLHSRENLEAIGGRIDTSTLAEDTVTTFRTQLAGKRVVFEGNAVVWAEEPADLVGLWKQRLRWARGNVQISLQFSNMWLHGRRFGRLGGALFALIWFSVLLMPLFSAAASAGLLGLYVLDTTAAWRAFRMLWIFHAIVFVFVTAMSFALDPATARRAWLQGLLFPGVVSLAIILYSIAPGLLGAPLTALVERAGIAMTPSRIENLQVFVYVWVTAATAVAYAARWMAGRWRLQVVPQVLMLLAGYGALLSAVTVAAYVSEIQGAGLAWDKTIKTGKVSVRR
jgi:cellulose synthase/poly-beta-1,6-N-acetylglucosamine synthase-like glycosyltransferase